MIQLAGRIDVESLEEGMETCTHFLVDSEMENGGQKIFTFAMEILDAHTSSQKLDSVREAQVCSKVEVALGFVLKNVEDGTCRSYYAHENNNLMERWKLMATKSALVKIKNVLSNTDAIEACTKERAKTKWKFIKLTNVTASAFLLKEDSMGCKEVVLPESLVKNHIVNCLTYEENTRKPYNDNLCLFRALALHLHGGWVLEEET